MKAALAQMKTLCDPMGKISVEEWSQFENIWAEHAFSRKEIITSAGEIEKYLYFITEGTQRIYYLSDSNKEATIILTYAFSFGGVVDSFLLQKPSRYTYESLSPTKALRVSYDKLKAVQESCPSISNLFQQLIHLSMSGLLERMAELQCFSSEEKFRSLLSRSPHILQLVPQKILANYLGIDPTNFSKLMNQVKL